MAIDSESMTTRELHQIRKKMWEASMGNHKKYMNWETGRFDSSFMENRECPVCGSSEQRVLFRKSGGEYVTCTKCAMVFLNPVFKNSYLEEYYGQNNDVQSEIVEIDSDFYRALYIRGINSFSKGYESPGRILDVGCSAGSFLDIARSLGWETFGLELNKTEVEYSRKKGHFVLNDTIEKAKFDLKFDVITLWDVFEHIKDGAAFLRSAQRLLKDGGGVFIQTPSTSSLAARILQEKCNVFDGLEHVNLYSQKSISDLAAKTGFYVESYETVISEIGVMNNYLQYEDPYLGSSLEKRMLLNQISEEWILNNSLGYKFQAFLKQE